MLDAITNSTYAEMQIFPFEKCFGWPNVQASPVLIHQIGAKTTINKHINKPNRLSVYMSKPTVFFFARACVFSSLVPKTLCVRSLNLFDIFFCFMLTCNTAFPNEISVAVIRHWIHDFIKVFMQKY